MRGGGVGATQQPGSTPLYTYYNGDDNMLSAAEVPPAGYSRVRLEGYAPPPAVDGSTVPLVQYYSGASRHHWAVTGAVWVRNASAAGFVPNGTIANVFVAGPGVLSAYE